MPDITLAQKSLLATIIFAAALAQFTSISIARGWSFDASLKLRRYAVVAHRAGGYIALILILTIAYYCVFGIESTSSNARTKAHALLGIASVGLVVSKVLVARLFKRQYRKLPIMGALLGAAVGTAWATSALWYYMNF
jgi:hypothetical protein